MDMHTKFHTEYCWPKSMAISCDKDSKCIECIFEWVQSETDKLAEHAMHFGNCKFVKGGKCTCGLEKKLIGVSDAKMSKMFNLDWR